MKKSGLVLGLLLCCCMVLPQLGVAGTITIGVGNTGTSLVSGTSTQKVGPFNTAQSGFTPPFNTFCGSDNGTSCSASWTFSYSSLAGDTINSASVSLGIVDIDSAATGNQVASYSMTSGDSLTSGLNGLAEGLHGNTGAVNNEYDVFTLSLTNASFAQLLTGNATFNLALQGDGLGVLGDTTSNGAGLVFSSLTINFTPTPPPPTPEPSSLMLLATGIVGVAGVVRRKLNR